MKEVMQFLEREWDGKQSLLLGYSGGPDSKALLYMLHDRGVPLQVAHVDHGWREESRREAQELKQEVEGLGLAWHEKRLEPFHKNQEDQARQARMEFFTALGCSAVLLGHHADDLAETVLKRILEGGFAGGMRPVSRWGELAVWRPLLHVRKKAIVAWLEARGLSPLLDRTNLDPKYLRGRMRSEVFPWLSQTFGKEVVGNLVHASQRAYEMKEYLERRCAGIERRQGAWGMGWNLQGIERIEARHLLQQHVKLSRQEIETVLGWVESRAAHRGLCNRIIVDRGWVFLLG